MSILYTIKQMKLKYRKAYVSHRDIGRIYDTKAKIKTHSSFQSSGFLESYKKFFSQLDLPDRAKILEIGSGRGNLAQLIPDNYSYMGIDISDAMVDYAIRENKENRKNISFEKVDARDYLKFTSPASYDLIILSFSRRYFNSEFKMKIFESLKDSGSLIMADEYAGNYKSLFSAWENFKKDRRKGLLKIYPYQDYLENSDQVYRELASLGYKQTVLINYKLRVEDSIKYLDENGIMDELLAEFSYASDHYKKDFIKSLERNKFKLPEQEYYLALGKK